MSMFEDIPVDVGVVYEGERIRRKQMYVEFGGPKIQYKFELVRARKMEEVEDGKIHREAYPRVLQLHRGFHAPEPAL